MQLKCPHNRTGTEWETKLNEQFEKNAGEQQGNKCEAQDTVLISNAEHAT